MSPTQPMIPVLSIHDIEIGEIVGSGSFSTVYKLSRIFHRREGWVAPTEPTVVKLPKRGEEKSLQDLRREAIILSELQHPNIIKLSGIDREESLLLLPYCTKTLPELKQEWKRRLRLLSISQIPRSIFIGKTQSKRKVQLASQSIVLQQYKTCLDLARALDYLHSKNYLYRDLKPENIGFASDGRLQLFDFGLAMRLEQAIKPGYDMGSYKQKSFAGSEPYAAPEMVLCQAFGLPADIFSFSLVAWEVLSLKEPFSKYSECEYEAKVLKGNDRPELDSAWSNRLCSLLVSCWQKDPDLRPPMNHVLAVIREEHANEERKEAKMTWDETVGYGRGTHNVRAIHQ